MSLDSGRWERAKRLYEEAALLPASEREQYLSEHCGNDTEIRDEVLSLLSFRTPAVEFLEEPQAPDRVGSYRIVSRIGSGGMSAVYLGARDDGQFSKDVAIKILRAGVFTGPVTQRFQKERQLLAEFDHPHIVRLIDGGVLPDARPYLIEDYVDGTTLTAWVQQHQASPEQRIRLFAELCDAVAYVHERGVVHRDLKPSNVLVTRDGSVKLLDFGIAKLLDRADEGHYTLTTQMLGTPAYASPEQMLGRKVGPASDVYTLGLLLYELFAGRPARPALTWPEAILSAGHEDLDRSGLPARVSKILECCLLADPELRPSARQLEDVVLGRGGFAPGHEKSSRGPAKRTASTRRAWIGAGIAAAGIGSISFYALRRPLAGPRPLFQSSVNERAPSLSADGRYILYSQADGESIHLRLFDREQKTSRSIETLPSSTLGVACTLSPNAKSFAYLTIAPGHLWDVNVRDVAGGPVRTIARLDGVGLDWAPDSETLVVTTPPDEGGPLCVWAMRHMLREKKRISNPPAGFWGDIAVATSPDGVHLAVIRYAARGDGDIWLISWDGRVERRLTKLHTWINGLTFTADGREILFAPVGMHMNHLYRVSVNGGDPVEVPLPGAVGVTSPVAGPDVLVFASTRLLSRVYRGRAEQTKAANVRLVTPINRDGEYPTFSLDGRSLAWTQDDGIWVSEDGGAPRLVAAIPSDKREVAWSPDRRHLAFTLQKEQQWRVWIVDASTGSMMRLTDDEATESRAVWSASGQFVYWHSERSGIARYFRRRWPQRGLIETVSGPATAGVPSADDRFFYYLDSDQRSTLKAMEIGSSVAPRELSHIPPVQPGYFFVRGSRIVYVVRRSVSEQTPVYEVESSGGTPKLVFLIPEGPNHIGWVAIPDKVTEAAWCTQDDQHDIWIYEGFR